MREASGAVRIRLKNAKWYYYTAVERLGNVSMFLFDFFFCGEKNSSGSFFFSSSSLLSLGCVGEISRCFCVAKRTTGGLSRIYRPSGRTGDERQRRRELRKVRKGEECVGKEKRQEIL